ncbi:Bro-N domain-containing protein [uncultured Clostridium sp.]|jgi:prophage antirepressor-like protein|uniref:BRO-N domain-containing protein n=1 Tax=uncultured Clostridium sp. TaxID=59620 RepID=UPI0026249B63|nr:Bro-N domain-containing protein [uncultured Clostridium sp.]
MDNLNFEREEIRRVWEGKSCYIAKEVAEIFGHEQPSKAISRAIKYDGLASGEDYDVLTKENLKVFKGRVSGKGYDISKAPSLTILYESGMDKFIRYLNRVLFVNDDFSKIDEEELEETENMIVGMFEGKEVHTYIINGRPCWRATEIASIIGYSDESKAVTQCIKRENYKKGIEYEVLSGNEVKKVIQPKGVKVTGSGKHISNLTVFYKKGLLGFINYSQMPTGKMFREWLRNEVFEELIDMEVEDTLSESKFSIKEDKRYVEEVDNSNKKHKTTEFLETLKTINNMVDEDNDLKIKCLKYILE